MSQANKPIKLDPEPGALAIEDCPDHAYVAPNICFRSPLFGVCDQRKPLSVMDMPVATVGNQEISYSGFRLSQSDLDIFACLVRLARDRQDETGWGKCSMYELLKATGRSKGKNNRAAIMLSMTRLTASALSITFTDPQTKQRYSYCGPMVQDFLYGHEAKTYRFRLNTHVARLFEMGWTRIEWAQRLALNGNLEKWLHGYFTSSHQIICPVSVEKIRSLCGSGISQLKVFRSRLKAALNTIKTVGCIASWHIDSQDRVHVSFYATPLLEQKTNPGGELSVEHHALQGEIDQPADQPPALVLLTAVTPTPEPVAPSHQCEPVLLIPLIKKDGDFPVYQEDIDQWQETFPGVDVLQQLRRIRQWNIDNPSRRKTLAGIRRHVSIWLGRDQDTGGGAQSTNLPPPDQAKKIADAQAEAEARRTREYLNSL